MKTKILTAILALFLIPIALAELQISPSSYDGTAYLNIEQKNEITLTNTFDFPIYNINFSQMDYTTIPMISSLEPNETKKINFTIKPTEIFEKKNFNSVVRFWYFSDIDLTPIMHEINLTDSNFTPNPITIKVGDSIQFNNYGSVFASITDNSSEYFTEIIQPNENKLINTFNKEDYINYKDENILKWGTITVENKTKELVTNQDYNEVFSISYDSKYIESKLNIELYPNDNLTMEYNQFQEINIRLWNTGNVTIHNINLRASEESDWFFFEENNLELTKSQNRFINLRITPQINKTEDTNKTYTISIQAESENAETISAVLRIFIPFAEEIHSIYYGDNFWKDKAEFCNEFPNALACNPPPKIEYREKIVEKNSTISYSKDEAVKNARAANLRLSQIEEQQEKQTKSVNTMESSITLMGDLINDMLPLINQSNNIAGEAKKKSEDLEFRFWLGVFLVVVIIIGLTTLFYIRYLNKNKMNEHP